MGIHIVLFYFRVKYKKYERSATYQTFFLNYWKPYFFYLGLTYFYVSSIEFSIETVLTFYQCGEGQFSQITLLDNYSFNFLFEQPRECISCISSTFPLCSKVCSGNHSYELSPVIPSLIFSFVVIVFGFGYALYRFLSEISKGVRTLCYHYQLTDVLNEKEQSLLMNLSENIGKFQINDLHETIEENQLDPKEIDIFGLNEYITKEKLQFQEFKDAKFANHSHCLRFLKSHDYEFIQDFSSNNFFWRFYQLFEEIVTLLLTVFCENLNENFIYLIPVFYIASSIFIFYRDPYVSKKNRNVDIRLEIIQFVLSFFPVLARHIKEIPDFLLFIVSILSLITIFPDFLIDFFKSIFCGEKIDDSPLSDEEFNDIFQRLSSFLPDNLKEQTFLNINELKIEYHKILMDLPTEDIQDINYAHTELKELRKSQIIYLLDEMDKNNVEGDDSKNDNVKPNEKSENSSFFPNIETLSSDLQELYQNLCDEIPTTLLPASSKFEKSDSTENFDFVEELNVERFNEAQYQYITTLIYGAGYSQIKHDNSFILKMLQLFWIIAIPIGWYFGSINPIFSNEVNLQC